MAGKAAPSVLDLQKDAIKAGTRNAGGGKTKSPMMFFYSLIFSGGGGWLDIKPALGDASSQECVIGGRTEKPLSLRPPTPTPLLHALWCAARDS